MELKNELVQKILELDPYLPNNSLDDLVDGLGGSSQVAEVSVIVLKRVFCPLKIVHFRNHNDFTTI